MEAALFEALERGAILITANRRLARALRLAHGRRQQGRGLRLWPSAEILPWGAWLEGLWQRWQEESPAGAAAPLLLGPEQAQLVWERVVTEASRERPLLQVAATARAAAEAWRLVREWRVRLEREPLDDEGRAFTAWAEAYRRRCAAHHWLDPAELPAWLGERFAAGEIEPPAELWLAGFDELSPGRQALLDALRGAGCRVERLAPAEAPGDARLLEVADGAAELHQAARWARALLERGEQGIGVVVLGLEGRRAEAERVFEEVFRPAAHLPGAAPGERPFNLSLGRPLAELPPLHDALAILELAVARLPLARAGALLRSPYLGGAADEQAARARLDLRLRRLGVLELDPARLRRLAASRDGERLPHSCPRLVEGLNRRAWRRLPDRSLPSGWSATFAHLLTALGWPGERHLESAEYQAIQAWEQLLSRFAQLDPVAGEMDGRQAFSRLRRLAGETLFQPEGGEAPVQVLGALEAGGQRFDHLWLAGFHDEAWPAPAHPNPFLPVALQRAHGLPHASAARELEFARRLTLRLLASAPVVVVSRPRREGDRELRPSPLLAHLPPWEGPPLPESPEWPRAGGGAAAESADELGPPLAAGEAATGGSGLLKSQAACPFQAFARYRLRTRALEEPEPGLDALERGLLMHAALETLWRELGSHERLAALDEAGLAEAVERAVGRALAERRAGDGPLALNELERARLGRRLREWLEIERGRPPFTVEVEEGEGRVALGGLELNLRIDRIDRLASGGRMLIDYKTGRTSVAAWFGERPDEPQLPLYVVALGKGRGDAIEALAFAGLRVGELGFKGLCRAGEPAPGITALAEGDDWEGMVAEWRRVLEGLAGAYRAGEAAVDPKDGGAPCRLCDLAPLCRV